MKNTRPIPELTPEEAQSFWDRVQIQDSDSCWPIQRLRSTGPYVSVSFRGCSWKAHRIAYFLAYGPIPDGLTIVHVRDRGCSRKDCCNPAHLEPVPQSVNSSRTALPLCSCGNPRDGKKRRCKPCHNAYFRDYNKRNHDKVRAIANSSYARIGKLTRAKRMGKL